MNLPVTVAAVDLGSNSFHMLIVRAEQGQRRVLDRIKESVRLAGGLSADGRIDAATQQRALDCLARFGQRLAQLDEARVRVVGTNTLRQARGADEFIARAEAALGHPIEIIYGVEEARLIYAGVAEDLEAVDAQRLVVDIGGGSTELVIGRGAQVRRAESVALGAVTHTTRFFADGRVDKTTWKAAVTEARLALEPLAYDYRELGWSVALGASGSIKSIARVVGADTPGATITSEALAKLARRLCKAGSVDKLAPDGVSSERRAIFAGGLAVLVGIFESLGVTAMQVSDKALREGVISDLLGRLSAHDSRDDGVDDAAHRFVIDRDHGRRVAETAARLWRSGHQGHQGDQLPAGMAEAARVLRWAAMLHEIGLAVAHRAYHKHGEYLLNNADIRGFSQMDQHLLATIVRLHRGRLRTELIDALPSAWQTRTRDIVLALRIAVILHRGRNPATRPPVTLAHGDATLTVSIDADWLAERPLTRADLDREGERLAKAGLALDLVETTIPEAATVR
ncbi:Ppx/GppA phosphatase family protein [Salinisphaera sp. SWV1]|uniref:Ppx/GppA phosphatase family protein n=1 Tax=Salinisphaera sp. SWV1 TaxID=3454139 RepID=UPI003F848A9A